MMKTYVKPELFFESFELSQHIAHNCTYLKASDGSLYGNAALGMAGETVSAADAANLEIYCYTNGPAGSNVLNS